MEALGDDSARKESGSIHTRGWNEDWLASGLEQWIVGWGIRHGIHFRRNTCVHGNQRVCNNGPHGNSYTRWDRGMKCRERNTRSNSKQCDGHYVTAYLISGSGQISNKGTGESQNPSASTMAKTGRPSANITAFTCRDQPRSQVQIPPSFGSGSEEASDVTRFPRL